MMNTQQFMLLHHYAKRRLLQYPNVIGVGFGCKEVGGEITDLPALRVYVREKLARAQLQRACIVPQKIGGLRTDVLLAQPTAAVAGVASSHCGALTAGAAVSNMKGVLGRPETQESGGSGLGTLGFFAVVNGTTARLEVVLVSNHHVLLAHGARAGDPIYQPDFTCRNGTYCFQRDSLQPVAEISDEGLEGNYAYSYPGECCEEYFIDCAAARLLNGRGVRYQPAQQLPTGRAPALLKGVARVHALDIFAGRELRVRKMGPATGLTRGRVVDVAAPALASGARARANNLLIRPAASDIADFAADGDSGALVVDEQNRAVGLLWGRSQLGRGEGFACHIHPVLDRLNVTPLTYDPAALAGTRPYGSSVRAL